jgi:hypothetical protein
VGQPVSGGRGGRGRSGRHVRPAARGGQPTYGDLAQASRIVLAVTDDPALFAALRGTYQAVLIDDDGALVEHSIRRPTTAAA